MKNSILLLVGFLAIQLGYTQNNFKGQVIATNGEPVPLAQIYFTELETGTYADTNGYFVIEHYPEKVITLQISSLGFETLTESVDLSQVKTKTFTLEESHYDIEEVVLSIPIGRLKSDHIVQIEAKKLNDISATSPNSLTNSLTQVAGVESSNTGQGIGKPVIRGLSGNRIVVYTQGMRLENQQWGDEHGLGMTSTGISSVEVIKGPASLLYGADAMGGVLYFVDEKYIEHGKTGGFVQNSFDFNNQGARSDFGFQTHQNKLKLNVFGGYLNAGDYQLANKDYLINSRFNQANAKMALGYNHKNWIANLRYSIVNNQAGISREDSLYSETFERPLLEPMQNTTQQMLSYEQTWFVKDARLNMVLGYSNNSRKEFEGEHEEHEGETEEEHAAHEGEEEEPSLNMALDSYTYQLKWHSKKMDNGWNFISGLQGMYQTNQNLGEEALIPNGQVLDNGVYGVGFWGKDLWRLQVGGRVDVRNVTSDMMDHFAAYQNQFQGYNYGLGVKRMLNEKSSLRFNLSSGFRAPNSTELLAEGEHHGTNQYIQGNTNLVSEKGNQLDLNYEFEGEHFKFSVNPFFNQINDFIYLDLEDTTTDEGIPVLSYQQQNAILYGGEVGIHYHPHQIHGLHIEANYSAVYGKTTEGEWLARIPSNRFQTTLKMELPGTSNLRWTNAFVNYRYKFAQKNLATNELTTPDYHVLSAGVDGKAGKHWVFNVAVNNLLNANYMNHLSRYRPWQVSEPGRSLVLTVKYNFGK